LSRGPVGFSGGCRCAPEGRRGSPKRAEAVSAVLRAETEGRRTAKPVPAAGSATVVGPGWAMFRRDGSRPGEVVSPDRHPGEGDQGLPCQSRPPHRSLLPAPAPSGPSRSMAAAPTPTSTTCGPCSNGPRGTLRPNAASTRKSRGSWASAKRSTRQKRSAIPVRSRLTASTRVGVRRGYGGPHRTRPTAMPVDPAPAARLPAAGSRAA
jgi:hypothetical protein